jgi:hypothetical protein
MNGLEECMAQFQVAVPHDQRNKVGSNKARLRALR